MTIVLLSSALLILLGVFIRQCYYWHRIGFRAFARQNELEFEQALARLHERLSSSAESAAWQEEHAR